MEPKIQDYYNELPYGVNVIEKMNEELDDLQKKYSGPVIIEEYDATCLIPPNAEAHLDSFGNIVIDL